MKFLVFFMTMMLPVYVMGCDEEYDREIPEFEGLDEYADLLCGSMADGDFFEELAHKAGVLLIENGEVFFADGFYETIVCGDDNTLIEFAYRTDGGFHRSSAVLSVVLKRMQHA